MAEIESLSENGRTDYQLGHDRLSDLPLSIIHIILARVPIEDAVRTCILPSQWRYTWTTLHQLVFDDYCACRNYEFSEKYTKNFISQTIFHHIGPIHKFTVDVSLSESRSEIYKWVHCLSRKDIRELSIHAESYEGDLLQLYSTVYSCKQLTYLNLFWCNMDAPPPTFKGFLFLRHLILQSIYLSTNQLQSLFSSCPLLERLELSDASDSELRFSVPNLKYLDLYGGYFAMCLNVPLLTEMRVELVNDEDFSYRHEDEKRSVCNYTNFFAGCMLLEKLTGKVHFTKYLSMGIKICHHSLVFHHLKVVELHGVDSKDKDEMLVVARLIIDAPNLQNLTLEFEIYDELEDASEAWGGCFRHLGYPPNFKHEKLRVVKIHGVRGLPLERKFIKFLLKSSLMLEKMSVYYSSRLCAEEIENLTDELLSCTPSGFCGRIIPVPPASFTAFPFATRAFPPRSQITIFPITLVALPVSKNLSNK